MYRHPQLEVLPIHRPMPLVRLDSQPKPPAVTWHSLKPAFVADFITHLGQLTTIRQICVVRGDDETWLRFDAQDAPNGFKLALESGSRDELSRGFDEHASGWQSARQESSSAPELASERPTVEVSWPTWHSTAQVPAAIWERVTGAQGRCGPAIDAADFLVRHPKWSVDFIGEFGGAIWCLCCPALLPSLSARRSAIIPREGWIMCRECFVLVAKGQLRPVYIELARSGLPVDVVRLIGRRLAELGVRDLTAACRIGRLAVATKKMAWAAGLMESFV